MGSTPSHTIGNALLWAPTEPAEDFAAETVATIALRIRDSLQRAKDPAYVTAYDAIHAQQVEAVANAELGQDFLMRPGDMVINSTWKYVLFLTSPHFT